MNSIPVENLVLRVMYEFSLIFLSERCIKSSQSNRPDFLHDDTRGCIFDMTGNDKGDVVYSLDKPRLCDACRGKLKERKIPKNIIDKIEAELKKIKKDRFSQILHFVKRRPVLSIFITFATGVIMSLIANFIYDLF